MLKIDEQWYDLTQWQHVHPGGPQILKHLHGEDATGSLFVFFLFIYIIYIYLYCI